MDSIQLTLVYMKKTHPEKKSNQFLNQISRLGRQIQPQCKSGLMKNLEPMLRQSNNSSSSVHNGSDMSYIQKNSIKEYAKELIAKVKFYREKSMSLFQIQLSKYESYYRQILDMINEHYNEGKHKIELQANRMLKVFQEWKEKIELLTHEIEVKCYDYDYQDKIKRFQKYTKFQVHMIEIKLPQLGPFKKALDKYLLNPRQFNKENKQDQETFTICLKKEEKAQIANKQKALKAPPKIIPQSPQYKPQSISSEPDDLLGCDQQLGAKSSPDTLRRRKYDVGRQNVIKQQDESDDTISNMSDS